MAWFGDDEAGFEVSFDEKAETLRIRAWGFWTPDIASQFVATVLDTGAGARRVTQVTMDAMGLKPQREAGQNAFAAVVAALPSLGVQRASVTTDSPLTKLQLLRISKEHVATNLVEFNWHLAR